MQNNFCQFSRANKNMNTLPFEIKNYILHFAPLASVVVFSCISRTNYDFYNSAAASEFWNEICNRNKISLLLVPKNCCNIYSKLCYYYKKKQNFLSRFAKPVSMGRYFENPQPNTEIWAKISVHGPKGSGKSSLLNQLVVSIFIILRLTKL